MMSMRCSEVGGLWQKDSEPAKATAGIMRNIGWDVIISNHFTNVKSFHWQWYMTIATENVFIFVASPITPGRINAMGQRTALGSGHKWHWH